MKRIRYTRSFFGALVFVACCSVILNIVLYSQLRKYYTLLYAVELDPLGLSYFQDAKPQTRNENLQTIVFFGDSRATQWPNPTLDGFAFINRGIGNQTTAQVLTRFEEHVAPLQPDILILEVGINDLKTIPLFPERKQEIIGNCQKNILEIIQRSLEINSMVVVSTIVPTGSVPLQRRLVWSEDIEKAVIVVNDYIRTLASDRVIIFDAAKLLSDENGKMKPEYRFDELHLNKAGYDALNAELVRLLNTMRQK